jgi:hypothetical protein
MDASRPELDPDKVATWQAEHGVPVDGRCGPATVAAAKKEALGSKSAATDLDSKKPDGDAPTPAT